MEKAIKLAIEGGMKEGEKWQFVRANTYWAIWLDGNGTETTISVDRYLLSPDFWQSLGKAMGWDGKVWIDEFGGDVWKDYWHRFIDAISEGQTPDQFFNDLLKS